MKSARTIRFITGITPTFLPGRVIFTVWQNERRSGGTLRAGINHSYSRNYSNAFGVVTVTSQSLTSSNPALLSGEPLIASGPPSSEGAYILKDVEDAVPYGADISAFCILKAVPFRGKWLRHSRRRKGLVLPSAFCILHFKPLPPQAVPSGKPKNLSLQQDLVKAAEFFGGCSYIRS